ncbi:hypothetical protein GC175_08295 [bacterium]|nr:hypothetical protein [bacterium]
MRSMRPIFRRAIFVCLLFLGLLTGFVALQQSPNAVAQSGPFISAVEPKEATAGTVIAIDGGGFATDNTIGSLLWDGELLGRVTFIQGSFGNVPLVVPKFASPGSHEITVCAGYPCFGGNAAESAAVTVEISGPMAVTTAEVAFVFAKEDDGEATALQFADLLSTYGLSVKPILIDELPSVALERYDLIIVGSNTGEGERWGRPDLVDLMAKVPRILALGQGGYALLGKIEPALGYPNGELNLGHQGIIALANSGLDFAKTPHGFKAWSQRALALAQSRTTAINIPKPPSAAIPLAQTAVFDPSTQNVVLSHGCRTFWGFDMPPAQMTPSGRALFANTVFFALGAGCDFNVETYCSLLTSPADIPSRAVINFDEWPTATVLGDRYLDSLGVRFDNNQQTRAITYADNVNDPGKSFSPPNVAINDAVVGNSAGIPMRIEFPPGRSHVGFRLGNGNGNSAQITAFDANNTFICQFQTPAIADSHTTFAGIYDAQGRIAAVTIDYGDSGLSESIDDLVFGPALYAEDIRFCRGPQSGCDPVAGATVHLLRNGAPTGDLLTSDDNGYLLQREKVQFGDTLWASTLLSATNTYSYYLTNPASAQVQISAFAAETGMTIHLDQPLILHDLAIATQWDLTANTGYQAELIQRIIDASNHLYDFTDGQMALGQVTVYQNYDEWNNADVRIYASNVMRPQAEIGGVVTALTTDPLMPTVQYNPGFVYMGSNWDRTGKPVGGDLIDPDWSVALAHELGHYLLFLFDTYLSLNENNEAVEIDTCTGSAMGFAYLEENTEFVFDTTHWGSACGNTLANQTLGRTEWDTIKLWYQYVRVPTVVNNGPFAPPVPLTQIEFVLPSSPTTPIPDQTFSLGYQNGETASAAARGWLIVDQRVQDQGSPISGTTTLTLNNAQLGDRFCLFDISPQGSRRQFGCEVIEFDDNTLTLRKDENWAPVIQLSPVTSRTINISVTQAVAAGTQLQATIYPEDQNTATTIDLVSQGDTHTGTFVSPIPATSAYVSVNVAEAASEEVPRREVIIGYGVGGSGAYGPAWRLGGAPIISSDGQAEYAFEENTTLTDDQYVVWQSMAGSPGDELDVDLAGNAYRLLARPESLAEGGTLSIRLPGTPPPTARSHAAITDELEIHFWTGSEWVPIGSRLVEDPQGGAKVIGKSRGIGVYALLEPQQFNTIYLPAIQR